MFLPGKSEIIEMKRKLVIAGVKESNIFILHSELSEIEIEKIKKSTSFARVVLCTNFAKKAVTIGDIDVVLDSGLARCAAPSVEYFAPYDYRITISMHHQRSGRVGRTKPGASILFKATECCLPQDRPVSQESICRVVALMPFHMKIAPSSCRLCKVTDEQIWEALQTVSALGLSREEMFDALSRIGLDLGDAAVLLRARQWNVAYEAAAVLSRKESFEENTTTPPVPELISTDYAEHGRLATDTKWSTRARGCFQELVRTHPEVTAFNGKYISHNGAAGCLFPIC